MATPTKWTNVSRMKNHKGSADEGTPLKRTYKEVERRHAHTIKERGVQPMHI